MNKKGISLVALVITIIVLIILTAAVVITGLKTPENAEEAVRNYSKTVVQDAVTLYVMTEMFDKMSSYSVGDASADTSTVKEVLSEIYTFPDSGYDGTWTNNAHTALGLNISLTELNALYEVTDKGVVRLVGQAD